MLQKYNKVFIYKGLWGETFSVTEGYLFQPFL